MSIRLCLDCGQPTRNGDRCPTCARQLRRTRQADRAIAAATVAASPICSCQGCNLHPHQPCGATTDLTAEHPTPITRGGTNNQRRTVLCRPCNSSRGNRRRPWIEWWDR